jgi:acyl carrier protein
MDPIRERLAACFSVVFPGRSPDETLTATIDNTPGWDSSRHFLLMQVIEETFGTQIPEEVAGEIESFQGFADYLSQEGQLGERQLRQQ